MAQPMAIELIGALKQGRRKTIGPLHLQVPKGYIVALVGPNGSGKSTMMQFIQQTLRPDAGEIRWFGQSFSGELPLELRQQIGYVPEAPEPEENYMTAERAAEFRSQWYPTWDEKLFEDLMNRFEVPRNERLNRMSKGERRKFEIAAALAARPKLLLLDEPSSGLDPFAWKGMIDELRDFMAGEDMTILIATHIVEEVKRLADYIALIHQGQVLGMAEKDQLFSSWKEIWIRSSDCSPSDLPEGTILRVDGPQVTKLVVQEQHEGELQRSLAAKGLQVIQTRSLELDEILQLWIQGHSPAKLVSTSTAALV
ncbi:ABC transporter ATP-binding protein [Paenibacillus phoenicis]|uniref:ABC transporter ATP-binding protein n=1 Tax=Paenibacillus phoenicis TaxID=554117 RepID=A0ABU5PRI9_9BACL|nr:ABC transporter ATP-binding protein [Paenibacillus phoenicis]MEA3572387.1 ABC transporter ATP-binding protein [Paenibacillus phoenicis]